MVKNVTRYLSVEKKHPRALETIAELVARAAYNDAGYEVFHKTIPGAQAYPASQGRNVDELYFVKVTYELVE